MAYNSQIDAYFASFRIKLYKKTKLCQKGNLSATGGFRFCGEAILVCCLNYKCSLFFRLPNLHKTQC